MILRLTLLVVGWASIVCGPLFAISGLMSIFNMAKLSRQPVDGALYLSAFLGGLPGIIIGIGFGAALLMLVSLDRRISRIERGAEA